MQILFIVLSLSSILSGPEFGCDLDDISVNSVDSAVFMIDLVYP